MMDNKEEASQEVKDAAKEYADKEFGPKTPIWWTGYESFIAGVLYSKPFEHNAKPEDNNDTRH